HSQCAGTCPLELFFPSPAPVMSTTTPELPHCHRSHGVPEQRGQTVPHKDDSCGSGPAIVTKVTKEIHAHLDCFAPAEVPAQNNAIFYVVPFAKVVLLHEEAVIQPACRDL